MPRQARDPQPDAIEITAFFYEAFDERHVDLCERAWRRYVQRGEGVPANRDQLQRLYEANPSGRSVVSIATAGDQWVGLVAGIATDVVHPDGRIENALQIGDFMVDEAWQRRGLGTRLLAELMRFLERQGRPVYTFPNQRSAEIFRRQGFCELRSLRSVLFAPSMGGLSGRHLARRSIGVRAIGLEQACEVADELAKCRFRTPALRKNGAYLRWRYAEIRDAKDYRFRLAESAEGEALGLVISTRYRFKGIPFAVLLDVIAGDALRNVFPIGARLGSDGWLGFSTLEPDCDWRRPRLSVPVPQPYDPRPVRLLVPPGDETSRELFAACRFTTADWMGF